MDICTKEKNNQASAHVGARRQSSKKHLQLSLLARATHGAFDETVGVGLGGIHLGILAGVLNTLVPAEI